MISASLRISLLLSFAACGGSAPAPAAPAPSPAPTEGAASSTPFDAESVRATLATLAVPEPCMNGEDTPPTLGALLDHNRKLLGEDSTEVTFTCSAPGADETAWSCMWAASTKPVDRSADDLNEGEGEGSAFQIMVQVAPDGSIVPGSIGCIAAG